MTPARQSVVDVQIAASGPDIPDEDTIRQWVRRALAAAGGAQRVEVSVRIVTADEMQRLNRDFRDSDRATNVLAFPAGDVGAPPGDEAVPLGDVVVCASVVADQAVEQRKAAGDHWAHMLVHGTLHLLGLDHIDADDAARMESLETRILAEAGVADPYRARQ